MVWVGQNIPNIVLEMALLDPYNSIMANLRPYFGMLCLLILAHPDPKVLTTKNDHTYAQSNVESVYSTRNLLKHRCRCGLRV